MLAALVRGTGIPIDIPFEQLNARHRRLIMHGCGDQWFDVSMTRAKREVPAARGSASSTRDSTRPWRRPPDWSPVLRARLEHLIDEVECSVCGGSRLRDDAAPYDSKTGPSTSCAACRLGDSPAAQVTGKCHRVTGQIAGELLREIGNRVEFLNDVGLHYLTLARGAATLSNGEAQRIRLASQLGSGLCGVLYVLDEPTIGLHPRDNARLLAALHKLRDLGNTLIVVEHDREVIRGSDYVCDFGPGAGKHGGEVVGPRHTPAAGQTARLADRSLFERREGDPGPRQSADAPEVEPGTPRPAAGRNGLKARPRRPRGRPAGRHRPGNGWKWSAPAQQPAQHRCPDPAGTLTVVTGPSGSGKSSLVDDVLYRRSPGGCTEPASIPGAHDEDPGIEFINKVIRVDQQPLGNSPASNPATYTGVFELIRELFAQLPEAKLRGYSPRRFSFNVPGGRCERCEGNGQLRIEMHFLPDVWVECEACRGRRYNPGDAGRDIPRPIDQRRARDDLRRGGASCSRTSPRSAAFSRRCATWDWTI